MPELPQLVPSIQQHHRLRRWSRYIGIVLICVVALYGICTFPFIQAFLVKPLTISEQPKYSDVVIVLGGGLKKDGTVGPIVRQRIQKGMELAQVPFAPALLMSGGPVKGKQFIESEAMLIFAEKNETTLGVALFSEPFSTSTHENAVYSKYKMAEQHWNTALLVTSEFHSKRACNVFRKLSYSVTCIAAPERVATLWERLKLTKAIFREYGATIYYKLLGYI